MKNFLKISLACLCLLAWSNVLKAQCSNGLNHGIIMSTVSTVETDTHVSITLQVRTPNVASSIVVGDGVCQNTDICSGRFVIAKECKSVQACLGCTVRGTPTAREIEDGCIVIVGPKDCD